MSELINPGVEMMPDVPESVESVIEEVAEPAVNYSEKNLAELVRLFEELVQNEERMKLYKEVEAIKAAFYKRLQKEKADAGLTAVDVLPEVEETEEKVDAASGATGETALPEDSDLPTVEVDALTGATVTSKAIVRGVNSAVLYVLGPDAAASADAATGATS